MNWLRTPTLRHAIVLAVVIGLVIPALLISGWSWLERYDSDIQSGTRAMLQQNADILAHGMQEPLWNVNQESASALLDVMLRNDDIIGIEVRDNVLGLFVAGEHPERRTGFTATTSQAVTYRGKTIGSIQIEVGSSRLQNILGTDLLRSIGALAAQAVLSIVLILVLLERRLVQPLRQLGTGAERLARGQLDVPFNWTRPDEIGRFGQRLERTRISLRNLFDELGRKNRELEQDIAMRTRIARELHERETRFRLLVEHSPIAIIEWNLDFQVIEWNAAAERIFGYPRDQAMGQHADFIAPNLPAAQADALFRDLLRGIGNASSVHENRRADGTLIICQWRNVHIAAQPGRVGHLLSMAEDITEQRSAAEALRHSEQRFAAMFHASPVSMALSRFDDDFALLDVNPAFERLHLRPRTTVLGKNAAKLGMFIDLHDRQQILDRLVQSRQVDRYPAWMRLGDGSKALVQISGKRFELAGQQLMIMTGVDVTDLHQIENQIRDLNSSLEQRVAERTDALHQANQDLAQTLQTLKLAQEELVRSEKLAALGALVAGIAHELNTPIGNSLMIASTLSDHAREFKQGSQAGLKRSALERYLVATEEASEILMRNLYRAADLVTSFKQVALDQTSSQRRRFSVAEVTAEIVLTLSPTISRTRFIVEQAIPSTLYMDSYPGALGQILTNLINNALLHGFEGRQDGVIRITAAASGAEWIELTLSDDGQGIPAAHLGRIFDPFFTTRLGAGGSGLGLNIAHNLVSGVLGGRIRVHSEVCSGTIFILMLPVSAPSKPIEDGPPVP